MRFAATLRDLAEPLVQGAPSRRSFLPGSFRKGRQDSILLTVTLALVSLGLLLVFTTTAATASRETAYLESQGIKVVFGLILFLAAMRIDYHVWGRLAPLLYLMGITGLLLVLVGPFGHLAKGADRWIRIGGITFQPADFARLALVVYLAFLLSKPREKLDRMFSGLIPCVLALAMMIVPILLQPNMSTAIAFTVITGLMLVAGRIPWRHMGVLLLPGLVAIPLLGKGYHLGRLESWVRYWRYGEGLDKDNYQLHQSIITVGSGGLFGHGLGESRQKFDFLPDARTDFIFAILGEELGFLGAMTVIALFLVLLWRAYRAARRAPDRFGSLLAVGIGASIAVYAAVSMAVVTGLLPTTGLPLPLVSYGGTSAVVTLFSLGILANIASQGDSSFLADLGDKKNDG
jgi:cell division protein FtsW